MTDIFKDNLNAQIRIRQAIQRSNRPLNKYNTAMHMDTEELASEPNDRTAYDVGGEPEHKNFDRD